MLSHHLANFAVSEIEIGCLPYVLWQQLPRPPPSPPLPLFTTSSNGDYCTTEEGREKEEGGGIVVVVVACTERERERDRSVKSIKCVGPHWTRFPLLFPFAIVPCCAAARQPPPSLLNPTGREEGKRKERERDNFLDPNLAHSLYRGRRSNNKKGEFANARLVTETSKC